MKIQKLKPKIEKEFDKKFQEYDGIWIKNNKGYCDALLKKDIEQFLAEKLAQKDLKINMKIQIYKILHKIFGCKYKYIWFLSGSYCKICGKPRLFNLK